MRKGLSADLEMAQRHVNEGEEHLARQRQLIAKLREDGHDVTSAMELLSTLEQAQRLHRESLERLRRELRHGSPT